MKKIINIFSLLFLINSLLFSQGSHYKWIEFSSPTNNRTKILSGESTSNFYLIDEVGNLFHFKDNKWKKFTVPNTYAKYKWERLSKDKFIVGCLDSLWRTHFYILDKSKWKRLDYINPTPIVKIKRIDDNNIYIYGNFGTLLKLVDEKIVKIGTKIENHINYFLPISAKEIYLGVKAEGIYRFDGEKIFHIPFPQKKYNEVSSIFEKEGKIFVRDHNAINYLISNDSLVVDKSNIVLQKKPSIENFGFRTLSFYKNDSLKKILFPNSIPLLSFHVFGGDTILTTANNSKLYFAVKSKSNYFIDMASDYDVSGISNITSYGAAFIDYDNDLNSDIFIFHSSANYSSRVYKNIPHAPFLDISSISNIFAFEKVRSFYFADLNCDYLPDLFTISTSSNSVFLNIYFNKNGFRFQRKYNLEKFVKVRTPSAINAIDYDKDGDLDIQLTYYYGEGARSGKILYFENKLWGSSFSADTSLFQTTKGWNHSSINADFTGNGKNDLYLITMWRNNKFFVETDTGWVNETKLRFSPSPRLDTRNGQAIDYDNDGDLDIFLLTNDLRLIIYENNGKGYFKKSKINIELYSSGFFSEVVRSMNSGDFNNDGFTDIFISLSEPLKSENVLLINDKAKQFIDRTGEFNIKTPYVRNISIGDVDNDGDLDILGTKSGNNVLWINNLDDKNYLEFILHGCKSNTDGISAKVFIYPEGSLGDSSQLVAFQQLGSRNTINNFQNQNMLHFGLNGNQKYDVRVKFYGGKEKFLYSISPGQIIEVNESTGLERTISSLPRILFQTITDETIQVYVFMVLLGFIILYFETKYAIRKYEWHTLLTTIIIVSNISFYYLLLFLTSQNASLFFRFFLPVIVLIATLLFTNLIFYLIKRYQNSDEKTEEEYFNSLLTQIMHFTHGEWALRNLNSLHLFCSNPIDEYDEAYIHQFDNRKNTFLTSTAPAINGIILLLNKINQSNEAIENIQNATKTLIEELTNISQLSPEINPRLNLISNKLLLLMNSISELRRFIFRKFSCNIEDVSESLLQNLQPLLEQNEIKTKIISNLNEKKHALIYSYELIDILDNSVNNSIIATNSNNDSRYITISLYNKVPHICIDIIDNGKGIPKEKWEKIFEKGFTESNGTGLGLHFAKTVLNKYGGRIYVKESEVNKGTIFTIEMIEGIKNAETGIINN